MTSSWGGPLEFHNIQEIVDIKLMFELIACFIFYFFNLLSSLQMIRNEEYSKTEKVVNYYYITVP